MSNKLENRIKNELNLRREKGLLRSLSLNLNLEDFCSNDYLGIAKTQQLPHGQTGSTGSRLISGNNPELIDFEEKAAQFFGAPDALVFNSGYDANLGIFQAIGQKGDTIFVDELIHASVRDGYRLSLANHQKFKHNNLNDLADKLAKSKSEVKLVAIESIYSMDGDQAPIGEILSACEEHQAQLIIDEAHGAGLWHNQGKGLSFPFKNHPNLFGRLVTFGKAWGGHGAVFLCSTSTKNYLINFSRSLIYSTAIPASAFSHIKKLYSSMDFLASADDLLQRVRFFKNEASRLEIKNLLSSDSPIQGVVEPGNENVRKMAKYLNSEGFDVRPIVSPTVPLGLERIRICIHSFNSEISILNLLQSIKKWQENHSL